MNQPLVRMAYMAGAKVSLVEIAHQFGTEPHMVRNALRAAGIEVTDIRGPHINVLVPIEDVVADLDAVGRRRRMSREEIAHDVIRIVLAGGESAIEDVLDRGVQA